MDAKSLPDGILVEAEQAADEQKRIPFALGTSELDTLVAYFEALAVDTPEFQPVKNDIVRLIHVLGESADGDLESLQKFSDEAYKLAFERIDAGTTWVWKKESGPEESVSVPSAEDINKLDTLNMNQAAVDIVKREIADLRWRLFAIWYELHLPANPIPPFCFFLYKPAGSLAYWSRWTWVSSFEVQNYSDPTQPGPARLLHETLQRLRVLDSGQDAELGSILARLQDAVSNLRSKIQPSTGAAHRFYQRRDPTALFSRIGSGWERDFSNTVQVRLHQQAVNSRTWNDPEWGTESDLLRFAMKMPSEIQPGAEVVLREFYELRSAKLERELGPAEVLPLFHDTQRDRWNKRQPWKPLFIEWEALYYDIPFEKWKCNEYGVENAYGASTVQYQVDEVVSDLFEGPHARRDVVRIAGRNVLQPQAQSSLKALVQQVFLNTNPETLAAQLGITTPPTDLPEALSEMERQLLSIIAEMDFVSAPLTAVTNSLLTVREGSHLKPLVRLPRSTPVAIRQAVGVFDKICPQTLDPSEVLQLIDDQGDVTPFASSVPLSREFHPLKPVQHGQLQFIKLNIVDKFGQVVHIVDPHPPHRGKVRTVAPIMSPSLFPGLVHDSETGAMRPNTAIRQNDDSLEACPFIALPPSINQPARLNAFFVQQVREDGVLKWRRISDWDSPVWGWIVVNYAEGGIQFFFENGQFYREVRFSSTAAGTTLLPRYLPFEPPETSGAAHASKKTQLDHLISKFSSITYLHAFWGKLYCIHPSSSGRR